MKGYPCIIVQLISLNSKNWYYIYYFKKTKLTTILKIKRKIGLLNSSTTKN